MIRRATSVVIMCVAGRTARRLRQNDERAQLPARNQEIWLPRTLADSPVFSRVATLKKFRSALLRQSRQPFHVIRQGISRSQPLALQFIKRHGAMYARQHALGSC